MMELWYYILQQLPFDWTGYKFMANAMLAVIFITPVFGILGTMTVSNRLAFFSDSLGHSALTGIALGVILGLDNPVWSMVVFSLLFSVAIVLVKNHNKGSTDTVIGVFASTAVALGIVILSRGGGFAKYTGYLVGDLLGIRPDEILLLFVMLIIVIVLWIIIFNKLLVSSVNSTLARSRGVNTLLVEIIFTSVIAIIVAISIRWVGLLIINSLLVIPAAAARNVCRNVRQYHIYSVLIALFSGISGLILSFYWDTASGATIILIAAVIFMLTLVFKPKSSI
jgi:zinc transport system permease protein